MGEVKMEWVRGEVVGRGSFGTVHLATVAAPYGDPEDSQTRPPLVMAVKSSLLSESTTLVREKEVLGHLAGCLEVVACYGDDVTVEADGRRLYNVFLEYVSGGALSQLCRRTPLREEEVRRYTASVLRGLRRVHEAGYVHCDVKPQNVLVVGKGRVKIADFGLAKRAGEKAAGGGGGILRGTPLYMAPETVERGVHEPPSDVWSLGCVVVEMVTGEPAWRCADAAAVVFRIGPGGELPAIPEGMSEEGKDFLRRCLVRDPAQRWTTEMLLDHPYVAGAGEEDDDDSSSSTPGDKSPRTDPPGPSPRSIFGFSTWVSSVSPAPSLCSPPATPSPGSSSSEGHRPGPAERLRCLTAGSSEPHSDPSPSDERCWIIVREPRGLPVTREPPLAEEGTNRGRGEAAAAGTSRADTAEPSPQSSPERSSHGQPWPSPVGCNGWLGVQEEKSRWSRREVNRSSSSSSSSSSLAASSVGQLRRHYCCCSNPDKYKEKNSVGSDYYAVVVCADQNCFEPRGPTIDILYFFFSHSFTYYIFIIYLKIF